MDHAEKTFWYHVNDFVEHFFHYVSSILLIFSLLVIFTHKELRKHPDIIFAYIMLIEAIEIKQHGWEYVCNLQEFNYSWLYKSVTFDFSDASITEMQRTRIRGIFFAANIFL